MTVNTIRKITGKMKGAEAGPKVKSIKNAIVIGITEIGITTDTVITEKQRKDVLVVVRDGKENQKKEEIVIDHIATMIETV